jgi:hypothetical protein
MKHCKFLFLVLMITGSGNMVKASASSLYPWIEAYHPSESIASRIPVPRGYERSPVPPHSFQDWLRHLPLKPGKSTVYLFNGQQKYTQNFHVAVVDIDVGTQDLQQCADAIIRLRAEYLYAHQHYHAIHFNFTSGTLASYVKWRQGYRPNVHGNRVTWQKSRSTDTSYAAFHSYLHTVFLYAGSVSLEQELVPVNDIAHMQIGDLFIQGGFPGHAVMVVDMAQQPSTGKKVFLLAQSYMPAQDIHILRNPSRWPSNPWYALDFGDELRTPEWTFQKNDLKRFKPLE